MAEPSGSERRVVDVTALRRTDAGDEPAPAAAHRISLLIGLRLARLVSEAPAGTRLRITTRGEGARLRITMTADAPGEVDLTRSGLSTPAAAVAHLLAETAGMLEEFAAVTEVRDAGAAETTDLPADLPAVRLLPRGRAEALRPTGFRINDAVAPPSDGD